jgi:hypothetical protein
MQLNAPAWKPGDRIPRGRDTLEVVEVRDARRSAFSQSNPVGNHPEADGALSS